MRDHRRRSGDVENPEEEKKTGREQRRSEVGVSLVRREVLRFEKPLGKTRQETAFRLRSLREVVHVQREASGPQKVPTRDRLRVRSLPEEVQHERQHQDPHVGSRNGKQIRLSGLRVFVETEKRIGGPHEETRRQVGVPVFRLRQRVLLVHETVGTHEQSHGREAVHV